MKNLFKNAKSSHYCFTIFVTILYTIISYSAWIDDKIQIKIKNLSQWIDIPFHMAMINSFVHQGISSTLSHHIINFDYGLYYHFLPNLLSSALVGSGLGYPHALFLPSAAAFYFLAKNGYSYFYFMNPDHKVARMTLIMTFLLGGLSWWYYFNTVPQSMMDFGFDPQKIDLNNLNITSIGVNVWLTNPITGQFLSNRGLPFGLALMFYVFLVFERTSGSKRDFLIATMSGFVMPIVQIYSSIFAILYFICRIAETKLRGREWRPIVAFSILFTVMSYLSYSVFLKSPEVNSYLKLVPYLGSDIPFISKNPLKWYFFNTSTLFVPLLIGILLLCVYPKKHSSLLFFASFTIILVPLIGFVQFQPNFWDNIKLYTHLSFFAMFLFSSTVLKIEKNSFRLIVIVPVFVFSSMTGILSIFDQVMTDNQAHFAWKASEVADVLKFNEIAKDNEKIWISNRHSHPFFVFSKARPVLGWYNFNQNAGFEYQTTVSKMTAFFKDPHANLKTVEEIDLNYVVVDRNQLYPEQDRKKILWALDKISFVEPNRLALASLFPRVFESENFEVYRLK